jgi:hypothetical protein
MQACTPHRFHPRTWQCDRGDGNVTEAMWQCDRGDGHGNVTEAFKALEDNIIVSGTGEVPQQLKPLQPHEAPLCNNAPYIDVLIELHHLRKFLNNLPKGAAPGLSNMTYTHIADACHCSEACLQSIYHLIKALLTYLD